VVSGAHANLPTDLAVTDSYSINPGDAVTLDPDDIQNADGVLPAGRVGLARILGPVRRWGSVDQQWQDDVRTLTFREPGTYEILAVLGIDNQEITKTITITVH
jgi:hypothetical protein